jgi:DNA-directed RNA polymerase subunit RPC12/RpoP
MATTTCPVCGSKELRGSHTRIWEQPLKLLTNRRAYRCRSCSWRGWIVHQRPVDPALVIPPDNRPDPDLSSLDLGLTAG